jgi:hypothetical protein
VKRALFLIACTAPLFAVDLARGQNDDPILSPAAGDCAARLAEARVAAADRDETAGTTDASPAAAEAQPVLGDVCPDLADAIDSGGWGALLDSGTAHALDARSFAQLIERVERYERAPASAPRPSATELAAVVASFRPFEPVPQLSLWDRMVRWIEQRLGLDRMQPGDRLIAWLRSLSIADWGRVVVFIVAVVVALGVLVGMALAAARMLREGSQRGFTPRARRANERHDGASPAAAADPADWRHAPVRRRPALMLAMLVERLRSRTRNGLRDSLTHRELIAAAADLAAPQRASFESVAAAAERVTFADWSPAADDIEPVLARGEALLDELEEPS